ncbi:OsmC family protein [Vampirovibrio sp.]|uniref:OsmC family protein n=1 Tax=Vampirovibrio sp. TaxID=2717857 RepID=UPI003593108C
MTVTVTTLPKEGFRQTITSGPHTFFSDLPAEKGGQDTAADPHQLFYAGWGACTNMTLQLYCRKKGWPLQSVSTHFEEDKQGSKPSIRKRIEIKGNFDEAQLSRLKQIAEKCPVNRLIVNPKQIQVDLVHQDSDA